MAEKKRKLYIGPRLKRLRRELGLTQAGMAEELEISPSYINLIERNQRPLTADLLLKLATTYDLDLETFAGDGGEALFDRLKDVFRDPVFQELEISRADMQDLAAGNPAIAEAVATLYKAWRETNASLADLEHGGENPEAHRPLEEARAFIQHHNNYFASLDESGERLARELALAERATFDALSERFQARHDLTVRTLPEDVMMGAYRRLDRHRAQIVISEVLDQASRNFQLALQLVYLDMGDRLDAFAHEQPFATDAGWRITRTALANYAAAAILMPYRAFHAAAGELSYDLEALSRRFGVSFEQVCHRLTTLQRPGLEGTPFFFLRVDAAGNVSKRYDGGGFQFSRLGGSCPLWNVHAAFKTPRSILTQVIELPDGERFFSIARTVSSGAGSYNSPRIERAVALGCPISHAPGLVYAKGLAPEALTPTPIGVTCRLCDRPDCTARAQPPLRRRLLADDYRRGAAPFAFAFD